MATPTNPESGEEPQEPQGSPIPKVSGASSDEQPSAGMEGTANALEEIRALKEEIAAIPELVQREVQSLKDKRLQPVEQAFSGVDPQVLKVFNAKLKEYGGDEDRAIREMELDALLAERRKAKQGVGGATPSEEQGQQGSLEDQIAVRLGRARLQGVVIEDDELQELWGDKPWPSGQAALQALDNFIEKKRRQESVTPAAAVGSEGRPPGSSSGQDELMRQYKARLAKIKRGDVNSIVGLKLEFRKKGLDI